MAPAYGKAGPIRLPGIKNHPVFILSLPKGF